jgi:sugar transferase (PEP-CTERM/EpsH1 system associated)
LNGPAGERVVSNVLVIAHRVPYPPNKGDKIRTYNVLRALAAEHRVFLGAFVDDPADAHHAQVLHELCEEVTLIPLTRLAGFAGFGRALLRGAPLSVGYYESAAMRRWVRRTLAERAIGAAFATSSAVATYLDSGERTRPLSIVDFMDVDSDKWAQYALDARWPLSAVYRREARLLAAHERTLAASLDCGLFVSSAETELFATIAPAARARILAVPNGVDTHYFDPAGRYALDQADIPQPCAVFCGAMDYRPNVDAVCWFVENVLPLVRARIAGFRFIVVGSRPARRVRRLAGTEGVIVTGAVPDVRGYVARANVVVAPLRMARGIQNKVLEALAMARPLVATSAAMRGLGSAPVPGVVVADDAQNFARAVEAQIEVGSVPAARQYVEREYGWAQHLASIVRLIDERAQLEDAAA